MGVSARTRLGLFLGVKPSMGGVYQYSRSLLEAFRSLPPERYECVVACGDSSWEGPAARGGLEVVRVGHPGWSAALGVGLTWSGLPVPLWRRLAPAIDPAARLLRDCRCDLWIFSAYSFVCYQMPVRSVGIIHDLMHRYERRFRRDFSAGTYPWRERVFRRVCRWTDAILVDSELGRRQVAESYEADPGRIHVLPYVPPPAPDHGAPVGCPFPGLPARFLFYPAQFWEHKNHGRLLQAMARLRPDLPDLHLVLAGGKRLGYEACRRLASELGLADRVTFLGYVPDALMPWLYGHARALVMPTFFGPTNIPPLEAFRFGCPVAVSGIYGMPEQVGDAALLFDPSSVDQIAKAIRRLWTDDALRAWLAGRGQERARAWAQPQFNTRFGEIVERILRSSVQ